MFLPRRKTLPVQESIAPHASGHCAVDDVLRRIQANQETLYRDAISSDTDGVISDEVSSLLLRSGCFDTATSLGAGRALGMAKPLRITLALARVHPSAAWNVVVSNSHAATAECYSTGPGMEDRTVQWCGSYGSANARAIQDGGHYLLTGQWGPASNADHADWATLDAATEDGGRVYVIVDMTQLIVEPTWRSLGLRGTASHTLVARNVRVPNAQVLGTMEPAARHPGRSRALRVPKVLRTSLGLLGVALGTCAALTDAVARRTFPDTRDVAPQSVFASHLGEAATGLEGARILLESLADALDRASTHGGVPAQVIAAAQQRLARIVRDVRAVHEQLGYLGGSAATYEGTDIGRLWRDARSALSHGAFTPEPGFSAAGRAAIASTLHPTAANPR